MKQGLTSNYSPVTHVIHEWLGPVFRPEIPRVELPHVPYDLVHELRRCDGVARGAWCEGFKGPVDGVRDVALVVRGIDVHSVPVGRERDSSADPALADSPAGVLPCPMGPAHGAPPNGTWFTVVKHRWQSCLCWFPPERSVGSPTSMRKPFRVDVLVSRPNCGRRGRGSIFRAAFSSEKLTPEKATEPPHRPKRCIQA